MGLSGAVDVWAPGALGRGRPAAGPEETGVPVACKEACGELGGASRGLRSAGLQALTFTLLLREGLALSSAPPPSRPETRVGVLGIWGGYR